MKEKNNGKVKVSTILLTIIIFLLIGIIAGMGFFMYKSGVIDFDKIFGNKTTDTIAESNTVNNVVNKNTNNNVNNNQLTNTNTNNVANNVNNTTALNTTNTTNTTINQVTSSSNYSLSQITKKEGIYDIKLPKLVGTTNGIKAINEKIDKIYNKYLDVTDAEIVKINYDIYTAKYNGKNILDIYMYGTCGSKEMPGDQIRYIYHYNIDSGEEFTTANIVAEEKIDVNDMNQKFHSYLLDMSREWGGVLAVKGWNHKLVTKNDMYFTRENNGKTYLYITTRDEDGYIIENEKQYPIDFQCKEINYTQTKIYSSNNM